MDEKLYTMEQAELATPTSKGTTMSFEDAEKVYVTQPAPKLKDVTSFGQRMAIGLTDYTDSLQKLPAELMVYMGNTIREGSLRAKIKRPSFSAIYDPQIEVGRRLQLVGLNNLNRIQKTQEEEGVIRDSKFDVARDLGAGAPSIAQSLVLGVTMGPFAAGAMAGIQQLGQKTEQMVEDPNIDKPMFMSGAVGAEKLAQAPLLSAIVEGGVEMVGLDKFIKMTGPFFKQTFKQTLVEGTQEAVQQFGEGVIDISAQTRKLEEVGDLLGETAYAFALGSALGGPTALSFNIANRRAMISQINEVVQDKKQATLIADRVLEKSLDDVATMLEVDSQLKQQHGEIFDSMNKAVVNAVKKSGALKGLSEEEQAQYASRVSKDFANQVVVEAFNRGVPVAEVFNQSDISIDDKGGIVLARQSNDNTTLNQSAQKNQINQDFSNFINRFENGEVTTGERFDFGAAPQIFTLLGRESKTMTMNTSVVSKAISKHNISLQEIKELPNNLSRPIMVFDSKIEGSLVLLTELKSNDGKSVVAAIHFNNTSKGLQIAKIASVHGKEYSGNIKSWIEQGLLRYADKKKAEAWLKAQPALIADSINKRIGSFKVYNENDLSQELFQEPNKQQPRASIKLNDTQAVVSILKDADPSSIPHELAHYWLDNMWTYVKSGSASKGYLKRWNNISKWLGITEGQSVITKDQQEMFAKGYESYLLKGVSPTVGLADAFNDYRKWLRNVYSDISQLDVELSPEAQSFFDSMMAVDKQYALNRDMPRRKKTNKFFRDAGSFADELFVPISTRAARVDVSIKHAIRKFLYASNMNSKQDIDAVRPFVEKMSKLSRNDYKDLDLALKNGDVLTINEIIERNNLEKEYKEVKATLEGIFNRAKEAGLEVKYLEDYFPRRVQDSTEYLDFLSGDNRWSNISKEIRAIEKETGRPLENDEKAHIADIVLRGYGDNKINAGRAQNTKSRTISQLDAAKNAYYKESTVALLEYVSSMNEKIETSKFLGNGKNLDESIGVYISKLIDDGVINASMEKEVRSILSALVNKRGTYGVIGLGRNLSYIATMGSPISAITQIGDLAFSLYKNGYWGTFKALIQNNKLTKQDIGIDNIIQEFSDQSKSSKAVAKVFKAVGLEAMDSVGKSVLINGAFTRLSKQAKRGDLDLTPIFGEEADQVIQDLINKEPSYNVKYLLFSELADVQPIAYSEMPEGYLKSGNGRVFYMLKTYSIKQMDVYVNEVAAQFPKNPAKAMGNLLRLSFALMLMGATADTIKDLLLGRPIQLSDLVVDNLLKLVGFSKFTIYQARREGPTKAAMQMILPPVPFIDDIFKTVMKAEEIDAKDWRLWNAIPVVGRFYYWWFGGGREYLENKDD